MLGTLSCCFLVFIRRSKFFTRLQSKISRRVCSERRGSLIRISKYNSPQESVSPKGGSELKSNSATPSAFGERLEWSGQLRPILGDRDRFSHCEYRRYALLRVLCSDEYMLPPMSSCSPSMTPSSETRISASILTNTK